MRFNVFFALKVVLWVKICLNMNNILGSIERIFPKSSFPNAKDQAKKAANKTGLNAKQRIEGKGKYSAQEKELKKAKYVKKNARNQNAPNQI